jgi:hypothetical protein
MIKPIIVLTMAIAASQTFASGIATVACGPNAAPVLELSYDSGSDAGVPGLLFLGVLAPDKSIGAAMTESGWVQYEGGLYPFMTRFDTAFPATTKRSLPFPAGSSSTQQYVGYGVYIGHGVLSPAAQAMVMARRAGLTEAKPSMIAAGTWTKEYESDDRFKWSLVQKDMTDNNKFALALVIPFLDCGYSG